MDKEKNKAEAKVYTVNEIMVMLSLSKAGAYNFIKNNPPFRVFKIGDGAYRIHKKSFDDWFEGREVDKEE